MSKYKVGDILEIVGNESDHDFYQGEVVEVIDTFKFKNGELAYSVKGEDDQWLVVEEDLSDLTFDPPSKQPDMVNSPAHYGGGKIECIDYIKDFLTPEEFIGYLRGNIAKYNHRWRYKNGIEDLKKSDWYLDYLIDFMVEQDVQNSK